MPFTLTAIGTAEVAEGSSATNTVTSPSFTPTSRALLVVHVGGYFANAATTMSVSDTFAGTGSWTIIDSSADLSGTRTGSWSCYAVAGAGPGTGTVTVTRTAGTVSQWFTASFATVEGAGVSPVVRQFAIAQTSALAMATLFTSINTESFVIAGVFSNDDQAITNPTGFVTLHSDTNAADLYQVAYDNGSLTGTVQPTFTGLSATSTSFLAGFELLDPLFAYADSWQGGEEGTSLGASQEITMPTVFNAGDLFIAHIVYDGAATLAATGWTTLQATNASTHSTATFAKIAAGSDTLTVTGGSTQDYAAIVLVVKNHGLTAVTQITESTIATGTSTAPNAGVCTPGVVGNYLWVTVFGADDDDNSATWWPTDFMPATQRESAQSASSVMTGIAMRQFRGSSLDAGAFTMAASEEWHAQTFAIPGPIMRCPWQPVTRLQAVHLAATR